MKNILFLIAFIFTFIIHCHTAVAADCTVTASIPCTNSSYGTITISQGQTLTITGNTVTADQIVGNAGNNGIVVNSGTLTVKKYIRNVNSIRIYGGSVDIPPQVNSDCDDGNYCISTTPKNSANENLFKNTLTLNTNTAGGTLSGSIDDRIELTSSTGGGVNTYSVQGLSVAAANTYHFWLPQNTTPTANIKIYLQGSDPCTYYGVEYPRGIYNHQTENNTVNGICNDIYCWTHHQNTLTLMRKYRVINYRQIEYAVKVCNQLGNDTICRDTYDHIPHEIAAPRPATDIVYCGMPAVQIRTLMGRTEAADCDGSGGPNCVVGDAACGRGFAFEGWSLGNDYNMPVSFRVGSTYDYNCGSRNIYARCTSKTYSVFLAKNAPSGIIEEGTNNVYVKYDSALPPGKTAPKRRGHNFDGYWTDPVATFEMFAGRHKYLCYDNAMSKYPYNYPVIENCGARWMHYHDTTIYAQWKPITYKVQYLKGTAPVIINQLPPIMQDCYYDTTYVLSDRIMLRKGYSFLGWNSNKDRAAEGIPQFQPADTVINLAHKQDSTVMLYAVWYPNTYRVTLDRREGTGGNGYVDATYDSVMPLAAAPQRANFVFIGYYDDSLAMGKRYYDPSMRSTSKWDKDHDATLYAIWRSTTMNLPLDKMGGAGGSDQISSVIYNHPMPSGYLPPARTGYIFNGYWSLPLGGSQYYNAQMQGIPPLWDALCLRLYAHWIPDTFNVRFNYNYTPDPPAAITLRAVYGEPLVLPFPQRDGYGFMFWTFTPNYNAGSLKFYETIIYNFAHDTTLYAEWSNSYYRLSFVTNVDGLTKPRRNVFFNQTIGFLPQLSLGEGSGYHLAGWFFPDTVSPSRQYRETDNYDIPHDTAFHAKWLPNAHTLRLHAEGGKIDGRDTFAHRVYYDHPVGYLPPPALRGATFLGYYDLPAGYYDADTTPRKWEYADLYTWDSSRSVYAHWHIRVDTLFFDAMGGVSSPAYKGVRYGEKIGALPVPVRNGHTFLGWHTSASAGSPAIEDTSTYRQDGRSTAYAHWQRNAFNVRFVCADTADTAYNASITRLYGDYLTRPAPDPQMRDNIGVLLPFYGWYPDNGIHTRSWNFNADTITGHLTLTAQWAREPSFIETPPAVSLTYGATLGQAAMTGGTWSFNDGIFRRGRFVFTCPDIMPSVADGGVVRYEIGFFPDDSAHYKPSFDSIVVQVFRRPLVVAGRTSSLLMRIDGALKAPGEWSDVPSYIVGRWDVLGAIPSDEGRFYFQAKLAHALSYYTLPSIYRGEVTFGTGLIAGGGNALLNNYDITYRGGDLYVTRIDFNPPAEAVYGSHPNLNARHQLPEYPSGGITYSSSRPDIVDVYLNRQGQWEAAAAHTGLAEVCAYAAGWQGATPAPPDTICSAIKVTPRRGVVIRAENVVMPFGLHLPYQYNLSIHGLHNTAEEDTLYRAGLSVRVVGAVSDTPPAGKYNLAPCCISHPNYADFKYQNGALTILKGGSTPQSIKFDSLPSVYYDTLPVPVKAAKVQAQNVGSRPVKYESSAPQVVSVAGHIDSVDRFGDTVYGARLYIRQAGSVDIIAYNEGDPSTFRAVFAKRPFRVYKLTDSVTLSAPPYVDVGETVTLQGVSKYGLPLWYSICGGDSGAADIAGSQFTARRTGVVRVRAVQGGTANHEAASAERAIEILTSNQGLLFDLKLSKGALTPKFNPARLNREYDYNLPCVNDTFVLRFDPRSRVEVFINDDLTPYDEWEDDSTFIIKPFAREYNNIKIKVSAHLQGAEATTYTLRVRAPLPKEYIYYAPDKFNNRMEVVNNPDAPKLKGRFAHYRWFENGRLLPDTSGVLYRTGGFTAGNVYSALGFYDRRDVYFTGGDSVYICGQTAVKTSGGLQIYPNPAGSHITARHPQLGIQDAPIKIFDALGREVASYPPRDIAINESDHSAVLDISSLAGGQSYVISFLNASVIFTKQ